MDFSHNSIDGATRLLINWTGNMDKVLRIEDFQLLEKLGSGSYATVYKCVKKVKPRSILSVNPFGNSSFTLFSGKYQGFVCDKMRGQVQTVQVGCRQHNHRDPSAEDPKTQTHSGDGRLPLGRQVCAPVSSLLHQSSNPCFITEASTYSWSCVAPGTCPCT